MDTNLSEDVATAIAECWPDGVIGEFDAAESYFTDIQPDLERDLGKIAGASLDWQTLPGDEPWQSYHVFFLSPAGVEFEFETEIETQEESGGPVDAGVEIATVTVPGRGRYGCSAVVSLVSPFAYVSLCEWAQFEDGGDSRPDPADFSYVTEDDEPADAESHYRDTLEPGVFSRLDGLRLRIAAVLEKHEVRVLDEEILDTPALGLAPDENVYPGGEPLVRDAFFFRGD